MRLFHSDLGLFDFQADAVASIYWAWTESAEPVRLALFDTGLGKSQPLDEPVLTPGGWVAMGDLVAGSQVFSADGCITNVLSVHPQGKRSVYRVTFSDGTWTRCDEDHLWLVGRWKTFRIKGPGKGVQYRERYDEVMSTAELIEKGVKTSKGRRKYWIPITQPVQYPEVDLPLDPYTLGVVIGDSWIQPDGTVRFSTDKECLERCGITDSHFRKGCWYRSVSWWKNEITSLGLAGTHAETKFVPDVYKRAPIEARRALLAGLLDTDSYPIPDGGCEFTSTSERLVDDVIELAESLGGQGRKHDERVTTYPHHGEKREGQPSTRANIKMPEQPYRLTRKADLWVKPTKYPVARHIESVEYEGRIESACIRVDNPSHLYLTRHHVVTHNTILTLATAALAFEDEALDVVLVVAEANKVVDWAEVDAPRFTDLTVGRLTGTLANRRKVLASNPQVLVTSWSTGRNDIVARWTPSKRGVAEDGMLVEHLRGRRVAVVFDEFSALRNRGNQTYRAWEHLVKALRKTEHQPRLLGLTATTVEGNPADHWNACRILSPERAGRVEDFDPQYVAGYDLYGEPTGYKNLSPATLVDPGVVPLSQRFAAITLRKRKTDPDVIDQFPAKMENAPTYVDLSDDHRSLYDQVEEQFASQALNDREQQQGFGLLRLLASHPMALFSSEGQYARQVVEAVGAPFVERLAVAKVQAMLAWQESMTTQQTVIFSFFGRSVVPHLKHALEGRGYRVSLNVGSMSPDERQRSKESYLAGDTQVFLSSDAGAKGLNLGCGSALLHYESPFLYSTYVQRSDRIHRIDSRHPSVTIDMLLARDTVEVPIAHTMLKRNEMAERVQDGDLYDEIDPGERFLRARDRVAMLRRAKG